MNREKRFPDNYYWPGVTALLYNVHLDNLFKLDGYIKDEFNEKITDIGFGWKKATDSEWQNISFFPNGNYIYQTSDLDLSSGNNRYMFQSYNNTETTPKYCVYPIRVLIKNLEKNKSYNLRSYYVCDGVTIYYGEQTARTLSAQSNISFEEPTYDSEMGNISYDSETLHRNLINSENTVKEIYDMFAAVPNEMYHIRIEGAYDGYAAAMSGNHMMVYYKTLLNDNTRSVFIHELAHRNMNNGYPYDTETKDNVIKFMEFATNAPCANWKWMSNHNYPIISSKRYDYMDDCLVVAACNLTQGESLNEKGLIVTYDIEDITQETELFSFYIGNAEEVISSIEIDDVPQEEIIRKYRFDTVGEHKVRYTFTNENVIPSSMFYWINTVVNVEISNFFTIIESGVFNGCSNLRSIRIPSSVYEIGNSVLVECGSLESISVDEGNQYFDSRNNCNAIIKKSNNTLIAGCKNTVIPNTVTAIGEYAFEYCSGLTNLTIPNSVTSIGLCAFTRCSSLRKINSNVAGECILPENVVELGASAFEYCPFDSVTIPSTVTTIGNSAFAHCYRLNKITSLAVTAPSIRTNTFSNVPENGTLYIPRGSRNSYSTWIQKLSTWTVIEVPEEDEYYLDIYPIDNDVIKVDNSHGIVVQIKAPNGTSEGETVGIPFYTSKNGDYYGNLTIEDLPSWMDFVNITHNEGVIAVINVTLEPLAISGRSRTATDVIVKQNDSEEEKNITIMQVDEWAE